MEESNSSVCWKPYLRSVARLHMKRCSGRVIGDCSGYVLVEVVDAAEVSGAERQARVMSVYGEAVSRVRACLSESRLSAWRGHWERKARRQDR
jgi:hypothetical protein